MQAGAKAAIGATLVAALAIGGELLYLHHERNKPVNIKVPERATMADDDLVFLKKLRPSSMADLKDIYGKTLWVSAGGQMDYYPVLAKVAQYAKPAGTLLGAQEIHVKGAVEQVASKNATFRVKGGDKQVLLVFTLPGDDKKEFAVPVGYREGGQYTLDAVDEIFFYEDPHVLYKHWGPKIWQAVDSHTVVLGMNERQVELSLGQVSKSTASNELYGNRMVVFANMGHPMAVTFVKNQVTAFRPDQGF